MSETITGGCLCGAMRYEARGEPTYAGYCYCNDCRRQSGSGCIGFMGFAARALTITGAALTHSFRLTDGRVSDRNHCAVCGSLVYGGIAGAAGSHTIYAGSLDDPARFKPTIAIFTREKAPWVEIPAGLTVFDGMPGA
jgi:hypothetical protein